MNTFTFTFFYCKGDSLLSPKTIRSVRLRVWVVPPARVLGELLRVLTLPCVSKSVCLLPPHVVPVLWLFFWYLWQKMPSHKCVLFSFALMYLLADNIPCSFNTWIPFPSAWPRCSTLGKSLASPGFMTQLCKGKLGRDDSEMTQSHSLLPHSSLRLQFTRIPCREGTVWSTSFFICALNIFFCPVAEQLQHFGQLEQPSMVVPVLRVDASPHRATRHQLTWFLALFPFLRQQN